MGNKKFIRTKNGLLGAFLFTNKSDGLPNKQTVTFESSDQFNSEIDEALPNHNSNRKTAVLKENKLHPSCPGKIFPMKRRGCGFHFYVCIDNLRKSDLARNKRLQESNAENNKYGNANFMEKDESIPKDQPKVGGKTDTSLRKARPYNSTPRQVNVEPKNVSNTNIKTTEKLKTPNEVTRPKSSVEDFIRDWQNNYEIASPKMNSNSNNTKPLRSVQSNLSGHQTDSRIPSPKIRFSSISNESTKIETEIGPVKLPKEFSNKKYDNSRISDTREEEALLNEYGIRRTDERRSSMKSRNVFSSSVTTLARDKASERMSLDYSMMTNILLKLNKIEDKLSDVEKKAQETNTRNSVGVSCKSAKSRGSVDMKNKENIVNIQSPVPVKRSKANTVIINVRGDDVEVKGSERKVCVTKRNERECDQIVYSYTVELDGQPTRSNTKQKLPTNSCGKARSTLEKPSSQTLEPHIWGRISEELKVR